MRTARLLGSICLFLALFLVGGQAGATGLPTTYRIALTMDGNANDWDDFGASPIAMAIVNAFGAQNRVVHVGYNEILGAAFQDAYMIPIHTANVTGGASRYGLGSSVVFSAVNADGTINATAKNHLRDRINESSASNPLFVYAAGPMEYLHQALAAAGTNRQYVTIVSHSSWNNTYGSNANFGNNPSHPHNVWSILGLSPPPKWLQIRGQGGMDSAGVVPNQIIATGDARWNPWRFLGFTDSQGGNANSRWLWARMTNDVQRPDASDSGMMYFLFTGFEALVPDGSSTWPAGWNPPGASNNHTLRRLLKDRIVPAAADRTNVRFEPELMKWDTMRFVKWSAASQKGVVYNTGGNGVTGKVWAKFDQLHSQSGTYTVTIRYLDDSGGACTYRFFVGGTNGAGGTQYGTTWSANANPATRTWYDRSISGVPLTLDTSEFRLEATRPASGSEVCYVDLIEFQKQ